MRALALLVLVAAAAPARAAFELGLAEPVSPRTTAAARRAGLEVGAAPPGFTVEAAGVPVKAGAPEQRVADWSRLRFLAARALASGVPGLYFRLPEPPTGFDLLAFPEEWQAVTRVAREFTAMRPVVDEGDAAPLPFPVPSGAVARAWRSGGRTYLLIVNAGEAPAPFAPGRFEGWRALFEVRADARQLLTPCGDDVCLAPQGVLWLEGRPF